MKNGAKHPRVVRQDKPHTGNPVTVAQSILQSGEHKHTSSDALMYLDLGLEPDHLRPEGGVPLAQQVELPGQLQVLSDADEVLLLVVLVLVPQCVSHFMDALLLRVC